MDESGDTGATKRAPPYIAFQTFKTLLALFKEHGVPGRIDRTVLTRFSGGVGSQVKSALRFLDLIDDGDVPKPGLDKLANALGTDDWGGALSELLGRAYAPVFQLNLQTASPGQFNETFRRAYPAKDETFRKCVTFFINAIKEVGIPISPYILKGTKTRSAPTKRANGGASKPAAKKGGDTAEKNKPADTSNEQSSSTINVTPEQALLDLLDPDTMDDNEQKAVFTLLLYLKKSAPKKTGAGA